MSKEDPTGLADCGAAICVYGKPKPEGGNPAAAVTPTHSGGFVHNALVAAEIRSGRGSNNNAAYRSLRESGFMAATGANVAADGTVTLTFGSAAESIAVTGATANPVGVVVATIVFSIAPTSMGTGDQPYGPDRFLTASGGVSTDPPPNLAPPGADRDAALAAAKAAAGVPPGEVPEVLDNHGKNPGLNSKPIPDSEILRYLDKDGNIRDIGHDYGGHQYPDQPNQNRGPHFNYPLGGDHYDYDGPGIPLGYGYPPR